MRIATLSRAANKCRPAYAQTTAYHIQSTRTEYKPCLRRNTLLLPKRSTTHARGRTQSIKRKTVHQKIRAHVKKTMPRTSNWLVNQNTHQNSFSTNKYFRQLQRVRSIGTEKCKQKWRNAYK